MKLKPILVGFSGEKGSMFYCSHHNVECANSHHENPPNRILNRFFEFNSVENKMQLESKNSSRK